MLAIVAIYSLRFLHGCVAKAYESCRIFVGAAGVLEVIANGSLALARWLLSLAKRCSAMCHGLLSNSRAQNHQSHFLSFYWLVSLRVSGLVLVCGSFLRAYFYFSCRRKVFLMLIFCPFFSGLLLKGCLWRGVVA
jgi:hypothetical protein